MLTVTSEYAIRAMVHIAQHGQDDPVLAREIADETGVPANYISKVLRDMTRSGILTSARGVGGGFRLARKASTIHLADIVMPFENNVHNDRCPFGNAVCSDETPCGAHEYWATVKSAYDRFLARTTLKNVAEKQAAGPKTAKRAKGKRKTKRAKGK